jgi:DNA (cytosine-5)-methyltransferase 1
MDHGQGGAEIGFDRGPTLTCNHEAPIAVRRLTVEECEFLQGFPRGYTQIPWRKKPPGECPDGPRYKALGNSWAVPCARWIGERIFREVKRRSVDG